jgi:GNAT superfamily N-acetyltransferase
MIEAVGVELPAILVMRDEYRREMDCQIVHDSWHARGFTSSYLLRVDGEVVGYGSVGGSPGDPKDTLKEFFVRPDARRAALPLFRQLVKTSGARQVAAQTNDLLLSLMLYDCAVDLTSETILFADGATTVYPPPDVELRRIDDAERDRVFAHAVEPVGEWGLERGGEIVATGGILRHYNPPYGDIYMEVAAPHRRQGLGSYLVQELKRICYEASIIPAARCNQANVGSRLTLQRAGLLPCARIVRGRLAG